MTYNIDLTALEEARLMVAAKQRGVTPNKFLKQIVTNCLPESANATFAEILAPVHEYSRQQGYTEEELDKFVEAEVTVYRAERRAKQNSNA